MWNQLMEKLRRHPDFHVQTIEFKHLKPHIQDMVKRKDIQTLGTYCGGRSELADFVQNKYVGKYRKQFAEEQKKQGDKTRALLERKEISKAEIGDGEHLTVDHENNLVLISELRKNAMARFVQQHVFTPTNDEEFEENGLAHTQR